VVLGIEESKARELSACIKDWIDNDSTEREEGAEDDYYLSLEQPYECKDAPLVVKEELLFIKGMDEEIFTKINPYITVCSKGKININTTTPSVLKALFLKAGADAEMADNIVDKIISFREGDDGIPATEDDGYFAELNDIKPKMNDYLTTEEMAVLSNLLNTNLIDVSSNYFSLNIKATSLDEKVISSATFILKRKEDDSKPKIIFCKYD
jgi:type II secretory pathway component PulK